MDYLIMDADCGFCQRAAAWLLRRGSPVLLVANDDQRLSPRLRAIARKTVVLFGHRSGIGSDAVLRACADASRPYVLIACLLAIPRGMREAVYRMIAKHRSLLSPSCGLQTPYPMIRTSLHSSLLDGPGVLHEELCHRT